MGRKGRGRECSGGRECIVGGKGRGGSVVGGRGRGRVHSRWKGEGRECSGGKGRARVVYLTKNICFNMEYIYVAV